MLKARSRQQRRMHRLIKDPLGPQMKRIDALVSAKHYALFDQLRMDQIITINQAIERSIEALAVTVIMASPLDNESLLLALNAAKSERAQKESRLTSRFSAPIA